MAIERHYSVNRLARLFDLSPDFWRKKVASGEISAVKVGRSLRVPESEVRRVIKQLKTVASFVEEILASNGGSVDL